MSNSLGNIYHKGCYRNGETAKHLRSFAKKCGNKRFRRTGKNLVAEEDPFSPKSFRNSKKKKKKRVKVRITHFWHPGFMTVETKTFESVKAAQNSINRHTVTKYEFIKR